MDITRKIYIQAEKGQFCDEFSVHANYYKNKSDASTIVIDIDETEVTVSCPDFTQEQFTNGHIEQLRKIKEKVKAETHQKLQSIDEQIESLLAIENKV